MSGEKDYFDRDGKLKAVFVRRLLSGECPCKYDALKEYFVDGDKVYKKV